MFKEKKKNKPIYINKISIEGVKCFGPKQTLYFSENGKPKMWTMILGDNGTGKSTILKSIALALSQNEGDSKHINLSEFKRDNDKKGLIEVDLLHLEKKKNSKKNPINVLKNSYLNIFAPELTDYNIPIFGYGSYRKLGNKGLSNDELPFQSSTLFDDNLSLINAEDWLLRADYEKVKSNSVLNEVERVKSILIKILREEVSDIRIDKRGFGYGVDFKTRYGWVNIKNLSTGYKSLITWMVDLANWLNIYYPESENPLNEKAIVLIDEIDLHLHVSIQKNLVTFLRKTFPKIQFIATAHSPLVVQGSEEENIIVLEKNKDHVLVKSNPLNVKNWRIDQILTSDLFGLESSRSNSTEEKLKRRVFLLTKDNLNKKEQEEIKKLNRFIHDVPINDTPEQDEASRIIQDAAETLKKIRNRVSND